MNNKNYKNAAMKAAEYIKSKEFVPGYFIKSYCHYSDVLNVNATCAAFFQKAYEVTKDPEMLVIRDRAIFNTVRYQFKDGAYPYASRMWTFPYEHHLNIRDPHYHALTLYFLLLSDPERKNPYFARSYKKAIAWFKRAYKKGSVDWARDEHTFSIGVTGAYGYAFYCAQYENDSLLSKKIETQLKKIQQSDGVFKRYERPRIFETVKGCIRELIEIKTICPKQFSFATRLWRIKKRIGRNLKERKKSKFSLYYTTQIMDCVTEALQVR
jgi:hypothetical protein